jgi:hypothetical protein
MCEKHEFIPVYYTEQPEDKVDWVIKDNQNYIKKLVTEEMNLADLLDKALKDIEEDKQREEDKEADEDGFEEELFSEQFNEITDEDIVKFREFEDELAQADMAGIADKKEEIKKEIKANEKKKKPGNIVIKRKRKEE